MKSFAAVVRSLEAEDLESLEAARQRWELAVTVFALRRHLGLSRRELAQRCAIPVDLVELLENGNVAPSAALRRDLAAALGVVRI